ncbi:hypothetical protein GUITHDRAFT_152844, partial [Guillardia theta CCMP2712]
MLFVAVPIALGGGPDMFNCAECIENQVGHHNGYSCPPGKSMNGIPYCQDTLTWDKKAPVVAFL